MFEEILILSPHTDDGELGCGGSISKFIRKSCKVYIVAFSSCKKSVTKEFPRDILKKETKRASATLGIPEKNVILFEYEVREFPYHRQEILEDMIKLNQKFKPTVVFVPSSNDTHQDHNVIYNEALRAFKKTSIILGYEHPWNNLTFRTDLFIELSKEDLENKIAALKQYNSQQFHPYFKEDYIRSWAKTRGIQIDKEYAETFEVIRWIM